MRVIIYLPTIDRRGREHGTSGKEGCGVVREDNLDFGRPAQFAVHGDAAAVQFDDTPDDGQAESGAAMLDRTGTLAAEELPPSPLHPINAVEIMAQERSAARILLFFIFSITPF